MLHLTPLKSLLLASALALLAATPASAQEKFRVITTFTVIADMAAERGRRRRRRELHY
ncbi:manganese ABC transporter [Klebsiella pneumoniae subsp. ozaenae]|uniref:Manganese ABC transporter n=1 Tax=Klebsiella pneumoniae subsp. ozaenae TaxID=574 RepID=A0A377Z9T2_KLEPO|nr:manganese ABC transporter [Klebsiella pneumoniae subsp. ozaenae]